MKKYLLYAFIFLPTMLFAQDYVLRAGNQVYKFDERTKKWSDKPLPINSILHQHDSIKSKTTFTVEVPRTWKNLFTQRMYTYIKYPYGVRLNGKLTEINDKYSKIPTNVIIQSDDQRKKEHIVWLMDNPGFTSRLNIGLEIINNTNWFPIEKDSIISVATPITMSIVNKEPFDVYIYILWKDNQWTVLDNKPDSCLRLSPYSSYEHPLILSEPIGRQTAALVCSNELIINKTMNSIVDNLNGKNTVGSLYCPEFSDSVGIIRKSFNLIK